MAINIFRANPPRWAPIIQDTYAKNPKLDTKSQKDLIAAVKSMEKMPEIRFDDALNAAVRSNNVAVTTVDTKTPNEGGNVAALLAKDSSVKVLDCSEITMIEYLGSQADEFVTLVMIKCWENSNAVKKETVVEKKTDDKLITETETKPKDEKKPAKEEAKVDYRLKCPLFEPICTKMGISNKGHK